MLINVLFKKQIHSTNCSVSSNDVWLERMFPMAFVPPLGMVIQDNEWSCVVQELSYNAATRLVTVYDEPDNTLYEAHHAGRVDHPSLTDIVNEYLFKGWSLPGTFTNA